MLSLSPLTASDLPRIAHIRVHPDQIKYSGTVAEAFEAAEAGVDFHAICDGDRPVGFFKIDRTYAQSYPFAAPDGLGLRAFMVDADLQGRGIGARACRALPAYLPQHYPDRAALWLTVNFSNAAAFRAYQRGGFVDTGDIWPHGNAGPQNILVLRLSD